MPGAFVLAWRINPPMYRTVMVRDNGCVKFAYQSPWSGWKAVCGRNEEAIEPPMWWWHDEAEATELSHPVMVNPIDPAKAPAPQSTRRGQLLFNLGDSQRLSNNLAPGRAA